MSFASVFAYNRRLSRQITPDHLHEANVFGAYRKIGTIVLSHPRVRRVVDVGAGKEWQFPRYYKTWYGIELVGLDISGEEMTGNDSLDERIVCDVVEDIPLPTDSVDFIMVHSGIEHFSNNESFLKNAFRILRPGGFLLAQFPGRYAPFAIANRLLPSRLAKLVLRTSMGETEALGFKTYYDRTNRKAFKDISSKTGFEEVYYLPGFYSSSYFEFLLPLYLVSLCYDAVRYGLGVRETASYNLFLLRKPSNEPDAEPFVLYAWK